jgi:7-cyano-7-deazaguanine synthase
LSGGLDSATCLALRCADTPPPVALSITYGQPNTMELASAVQLASYYGCELIRTTIDLPWASTPLVADSGSAPADQPRPRHYVPARNLVLLSIAMAVAESRDLDRIYLGTNADDGRYPDTTAAFIEAFSAAASVGVQRAHDGRPIAVRTPLAGITKAGVVRLALEIGVPIDLTWSCYGAGRQTCGVCGACVVRRDAFAAAGVPDPAMRADCSIG